MGNVRSSDLLVSDMIAEADLNPDFAALAESTKLLLLGSATELLANDNDVDGNENYIADTSTDALPLSSTLKHFSRKVRVNAAGQFINYPQAFDDDNHSLDVWGRKDGQDIGVRYIAAADGTGFQAYPDEDDTDVYYTAEEFA
jgi:hypothetical protein